MPTAAQMNKLVVNVHCLIYTVSVAHIKKYLKSCLVYILEYCWN